MNMQYLTGLGYKTREGNVPKTMVYGYWRNDEIENAIVVTPAISEAQRASVYQNEGKSVLPIRSKFIGLVDNLKMVRGTLWERNDIPLVIKQRIEIFTKSSFSTPIFQGAVNSFSTVYYGGFDKHEKKRGYGFLVYKGRPDLACYAGFFKDDFEHGLGTRTMKDGTQQSGVHVNGKLVGPGVKVWPDNWIDKRTRYTGNFVEDHPSDRQGKMEWQDGTTYIGQFTLGVMSGQGIKSWPNGNRFVGNFFQDMMSSNGKMHFADGRIGTGKWKENQLHGPYTEEMPGEWKKEELYRMGWKTRSTKYSIDKDGNWVLSRTRKKQ